MMAGKYPYRFVVMGIISLVALKVYSLIMRTEHLYRDFSVDEEVLSKSSLA